MFVLYAQPAVLLKLWILRCPASRLQFIRKAVSGMLAAGAHQCDSSQLPAPLSTPEGCQSACSPRQPLWICPCMNLCLSTQDWLQVEMGACSGRGSSHIHKQSAWEAFVDCCSTRAVCCPSLMRLLLNAACALEAFQECLASQARQAGQRPAPISCSKGRTSWQAASPPQTQGLWWLVTAKLAPHTA